MTEAPTPGERRLSHPPSDRYRLDEAQVMPPDPAASRVRGIVFAAIGGLLGAVAITVLGGVFAVSAGLIVVAGATGWTVASGLRAGAGDQLSLRGRVQLALALTLVAVALGQAGLWLYARTEGGVLAPLDYLWEVFGVLVPLEFAVAAVIAWVTAR